MIGIAASMGVTRLIRSLIYGVTPTDPVIFVGLSALLLIVAVAACYIPARYARRSNGGLAQRINRK